MKGISSVSNTLNLNNLRGNILRVKILITLCIHLIQLDYNNLLECTVIPRVDSCLLYHWELIINKLSITIMQISSKYNIQHFISCKCVKSIFSVPSIPLNHSYRNGRYLLIHLQCIKFFQYKVYRYIFELTGRLTGINKTK